jgi:hypothetical protein
LVEYNKVNRILISLIFFIFIAISLIQFIPFSTAQTNGEPISLSSSLEFIEYSEIQGIKGNVSEVNIELPEPNWTISDVQINFSDISLGNEIRTIEDTETGLDLIENKNVNFRTFALATQIEILEVTELFGVFIKGYKTSLATETIKFQIQGYNETDHTPDNSTIHGSIDLNISTSLDWYYQDFSSDPITLSVGNYSFVMNGTNLGVNPDAKYYWFIDDSDPDIPYLHTSSFVTSWSTGSVNTSFLCKLNQRRDKFYFPSDINMTAELNGDNYEIINGLILGMGSLEIFDLDHFLEDTNLNIHIQTNETYTLKFNCNYTINLKNEFITESIVEVIESSIYWSMVPVFNRISQNYFVQFYFPQNWYNFSVIRDGFNVTSLVNIDMINKSISIPNATIEDGAVWEIKANSPSIDLTLNFPTKVQTGKLLEISVNAPSTQGNISFVIVKPRGFTELIGTQEAVSGEVIFEFLIPKNWTKGEYFGEIYWNNKTDVGMKSEDFQVFEPYLFPWDIVVIIVIATIGISILSFMSYRTIKNFRNKQIEKKQKIYNSCMDVLHLDYIMVTDKKSGLNVYTQNFSEKKIDAALISGFLQAIHSFGIELIKVEDQSQTIKLEYKDSIVLMSEFVNVRLILIMKERPSRFFLYSLEELAYDIYKNYGAMIDSFDGNVEPFQSIETLLKRHLEAIFIYPLRIAQIDKLEKVRISQNERNYINKAVSLMKTKNMNHFYVRSLLTEKECSPKDVETILDLMAKKVFQVI